MRRFFKVVILVLTANLYSQYSSACFCGRTITKLDSLSQLAEYDFIAMAKVLGERDLENGSSAWQNERTGELFKSLKFSKGIGSL